MGSGAPGSSAGHGAHLPQRLIELGGRGGGGGGGGRGGGGRGPTAVGRRRCPCGRGEPQCPVNQQLASIEHAGLPTTKPAHLAARQQRWMSLRWKSSGMVRGVSSSSVAMVQ